MARPHIRTDSQTPAKKQHKNDWTHAIRQTRDKSNRKTFNRKKETKTPKRTNPPGIVTIFLTQKLLTLLNPKVTSTLTYVDAYLPYTIEDKNTFMFYMSLSQRY